MGLFDKIKDNAKNISMRALYEEVPDTPPPAPVEEPKEASLVMPDTPEGEVPAFDETPVETTAEQEIPVIVKEVKKEEKDEKSITVTKKPVVTKPVIKRPAPKPIPVSPVPGSRNRVIDVAPNRGVLDPTRKAIYARERAALVALAARRRMEGTVPLYVANHLSFKTRVFIDRIEYSGSFGKNVLPIDNISWIKLRAGGTGVILETVEGKRVVMVVKPRDRLAFADAVMKVQEMQPKREKFRDTKTVRIDQLEKFGEGVDEIEKLAKLFDKGIITQAEFDTKKKQILGI
jgi:hypothetical protein